MTSTAQFGVFGAFTLIFRQQFFTQSDVIGSDFHQLIILDELQCLLKRVAYGGASG